MQTILWIAGVLAMWTAIKFVFLVFKRLGSKNSMNDLLDRMEDTMVDGADAVAGYFKQKKRKKKESEKPIVTIR